MSERVTIEYEGVVHDPFEPGREWADQWPSWTPEEAEYRREVVEFGLLRAGDARVPEARAQLIRSTILGLHEGLPQIAGPAQPGPVRWLVPELLAAGNFPMLSGPPKIGKSSFVAEFVAALVIPGRRFLDAFEPVQWSDDEVQRDVWLFNAENPPELLHQALLDAGLHYDANEPFEAFYFHPSGGPVLIVAHLEELGGPDTFDLTHEAARVEWGGRLAGCPCREVESITSPLVVVVDGITAIAGLERYGAWYAEFRGLMHSLDTLAGVVVGHAALGSGHAFNGVESMALPDGLWSLTSNDRDIRPGSARFFEATRRLIRGGIRKSRLTIGPDGLMQLALVGTGAAAVDQPEADAEPVASYEQRILDRLKSAHPAGVMGSELTGGGREGKLLRAARVGLAERGAIYSRPEGLGQRWHLADST